MFAIITRTPGVAYHVTEMRSDGTTITAKQEDGTEVTFPESEVTVMGVYIPPPQEQE